MDFSTKPELAKTIGYGVVFPFELVNGSLPLECSSEMIASNIKINLTWPKLNRFFLAEYGGGIDDLLDDPNDDIISNLAETLVKRSLAQWTPYLQDISVTFVREEADKASLFIRYSLGGVQAEPIEIKNN